MGAGTKVGSGVGADAGAGDCAGSGTGVEADGGAEAGVVAVFAFGASLTGSDGALLLAGGTELFDDAHPMKTDFQIFSEDNTKVYSNEAISTAIKAPKD